MHSDDWNLLGMLWENSLFIDTTLPFGLRSAPKIFLAAAEWIAKQQVVTTILHYLDDFLVIGSPGSTECMANVALVLSTFEHLGIPVAMNKLEGPCCVLTFLGIELARNNQATSPETSGFVKLDCNLGRKENH